MKLSLFTITAALLALSSCTGNQITVTHDEGRTRVEAWSDNIFRVTSVPAGVPFTDGQSLMALPHRQKTTTETVRTDSTLVISTPKISASVRLDDGRVSFFRADGTPITAEHARTFAPISVEGTSAWTVSQSFDSPADEAFFGLGQHQADEWNYKGRNEELYQYNTKISIPFVVSSHRYGLLWDSNSFCRWGDPRDYSQIGDVFTLFDKNGDEGALTGTYTAKDGSTLIRRETALAQEFLETPKCDRVRNSPDFAFNGANVLFEGELLPHESGLYHFYIYYAGYTKVFVDDRQVTPEIWRTAWNPNGRKFAVDLQEGRRVPIRIEWKPDGDVSYCGLRVLSPVPAEIQNRMNWWGEMQNQIDYYLIAGENIDEVISGYRTVTGKAQILPRWAMGYWQSRERYSSSEDIISTLKTMRAKGIPVDNIVQDWRYWEDGQWGSHEFDPARYPDPKAMIDSVHALNAKFMISVWPKFYRNTEHFKELDEKGWIYRRAIVDSVADWLGYQQSFYDAYSEGARNLFWGQMKEHLYPLGVDSWWMDASEPNIHDCTDMDYRKAMCGPTALGPSTEYFNAYALMNAQAIYEGQRSADPDRRVFLLTRSGFPGLQRYATASWSGDIGTRWEDMKAQISAGLNYCISGLPFWTQDIGGFSVENRFMTAQHILEDTGEVNEDMKEWREMQTRWHEWGIFCPLYRVHGQWPLREPHLLAPENSPAYKAILAADKLRYSLLPYIYTMNARVHFDDYTMMRPLVMDFTDDARALSVSDEFMFGDAFLVCPVYEYKARSREVYLPEGKWYDFYTGEILEGGRSFTAPAPFERIPLYARAGQIVPIGPDIQYTAQDDGSRLTLRIYAGADASYTLYEDDGQTYAYEKGVYATIPITWDDASGELTIGRRCGSFPQMSPVKHIQIEIISADGIRKTSAEYAGEELRLRVS